MQKPFFFGYGSLVNRATHTYQDTSTAQLVGWRRLWQDTPGRETPFLSVEPLQGVTIDGLIAHVPDGDWDQLDIREEGYDRLPTQHVQHNRQDAPEIAVYVVPKPKDTTGTGAILLSYLDVVVQGFFKEFGEAGVKRFFDTTTGWDRPIDNDRQTPKYPRAQLLSPTETELVHSELERLGIRL